LHSDEPLCKGAANSTIAPDVVVFRGVLRRGMRCARGVDRTRAFKSERACTKSKAGMQRCEKSSSRAAIAAARAHEPRATLDRRAHFCARTIQAVHASIVSF
jgi:hypothetical protein